MKRGKLLRSVYFSEYYCLKAVFIDTSYIDLHFSKIIVKLVVWKCIEDIIGIALSLQYVTGYEVGPLG